MRLFRLAARVASQKFSKTRSDKEKVQSRSFEDFRKEWEGQDVFIRFENKKFSESDKWVPASLNRDSTYGDIWGVWSFSLKHAWPTQKYLTNLGTAYILKSKSAKIVDTESYSEKDLERDISVLQREYGDKVQNASKEYEENKELCRQEGLETCQYNDPNDGPPFYRLYHIVQDILGTTKSTNIVFRKLGYQLIIDSAAIVSEGVYAPSVSAVFLDPTALEVVDACGTKS